MQLLNIHHDAPVTNSMVRTEERVDAGWPSVYLVTEHMVNDVGILPNGHVTVDVVVPVM